MEYSDVCDYLDKCLVFGIKPGLVRIQKILELLGNPQKKVEFIHVVGTNGKTSTTRITAEILRSHGIKTGYHISPHITGYTERMGINGRDVSEKKFSQIFNEIYPCIKRVNSLNLEGPITQFEIISAMAFKLAENEGIEVMVLEAGMGGRWDATNAARAKVVGLTGVSLEHTQWLGDTIRKISLEKVEVIKERALVATTSRNREVLRILKDKVTDTDSRLFLYGRDFYIAKKVNPGPAGWLLDIRGIKDVYNNLKLPLAGSYQPLNLSLAIALAELYMETRAKKPDSEKIRACLGCLRIKGRFEIIREKPLMIADASHNPEGIDSLVKNMAAYFRERKKIIIFAVLKDKDYESMIEKILNAGDVLILTSSLNKRSLSPGRLEKAVKAKIKEVKNTANYPGKLYRINNIENSIKFALKISGLNDIICITGSITNLENIVN